MGNFKQYLNEVLGLGIFSLAKNSIVEVKKIENFEDLKKIITETKWDVTEQTFEQYKPIIVFITHYGVYGYSKVMSDVVLSPTNEKIPLQEYLDSLPPEAVETFNKLKGE